MSVQNANFPTPPSDKDTPQQDRSLFHHEAKKHESHHYVRMYGGQVLNAAMWGFGATLGADAANAAVGEERVRALESPTLKQLAKIVLQEWWRH